MENKKETVEQIIKRLWEAGEKQSNIAKTLNDAGYTTFMQKPWTQATVSYIALDQLELKPRQVKSTGNVRGPYKGHEITESIPGEVYTPDISSKLRRSEIIENESEENLDTKLALIDNAVFTKDQNIYTDSLTVAQIFDKRHKDVLESIDNLLIDLGEKGQPNFPPSFYKNSQNKNQKKYLLTKKGLSLLAFGFTGKKALQFKLAYIEKFEEMEEALKKPSLQTPKNSMELLKTFFNALDETNERIDNIPNLIEETVNEKISRLQNQSFQKLSTFPKPLIQVSMFVDPNIDQAETDRLIKEWSTSKGLNVQNTYRALYKVFQAVRKINLYKLAENAGKRKLNYISDSGMLPDFYAFVYQNLVEHDGKYLNHSNIEMA